MDTRHEARAVVLSVALCFLLAAGVILLAGAPARAALYVGYDHPESALGGPTTLQGMGWMDKVWSRRLTCAGKLPGGPLRVVMLVNRSGLAMAKELGRYLALDSTIIQPSGDANSRFVPADFDEMRQLLLTGKHIDAFLISRVDASTIPADIVYDILSRVKNEGTGLVLQDEWGGHPLNPEVLGLKPVAQDKQLLVGIPYEGLRFASE